MHVFRDLCTLPGKRGIHKVGGVAIRYTYVKMNLTKKPIAVNYRLEKYVVNITAAL